MTPIWSWSSSENREKWVKNYGEGPTALSLIFKQIRKNHYGAVRLYYAVCPVREYVSVFPDSCRHDTGRNFASILTSLAWIVYGLMLRTPAVFGCHGNITSEMRAKKHRLTGIAIAHLL